MKRWIIGTVAFVLLIAFGYWFLAVDSCLDSGGRWDYPFGGCEH